MRKSRPAQLIFCRLSSMGILQKAHINGFIIVLIVVASFQPGTAPLLDIWLTI